MVALSLLPPVVVGFALERPIERYLGKPGTIAVGLIAGGAALAWADREPQERELDDGAPIGRPLARDRPGLCAVPGVSRNGATLTAARLRRFTRVDAERLSRHVALPVIGGATFLKCLRLWQRGLPEGSGPAFAVGVVASFASTLASTPLIELVERDRPLLAVRRLPGRAGQPGNPSPARQAPCRYEPVITVVPPGSATHTQQQVSTLHGPTRASRRSSTS